MPTLIAAARLLACPPVGPGQSGQPQALERDALFGRVLDVYLEVTEFAATTRVKVVRPGQSAEPDTAC
jgi:hypothetical protein